MNETANVGGVMRLPGAPLLTASRAAVLIALGAVLCPTVIDALEAGSIVNTVCVVMLACLASFVLLFFVAELRLNETPSAAQMAAVMAEAPAIVIAY